MRSRVLFLVLMMAMGSEAAFAKGFSDLSLDTLREQVLREKTEISGHWRSGEKWKGYLCQGEYHYDAGLKGNLDDLKMQVVGEGALDLEAEVVDVFGDAKGSYRTSSLLCIPFHLGVKFLIERVSVKAKAHLVEEGENSKIQLRILSTRLGTIHFGKSLSPSLEKFITRLANGAFHWVWDSRLGAWLSKKLSDEINKHRN